MIEQFVLSKERGRLDPRSLAIVRLPMSNSDYLSFRGYVEDNGGAVSIAEATGALLDLGYRISTRELAELHDDLDGPIVGRSRVITPELADQIADELDDLADDDESDADEADDDGDEEEDEGDDEDE